jgi:hypothetical protein
MHHLSTDEKINLLRMIRDNCGDNLPRQGFTDFCFDLFEDIPGMEGIPLDLAMDIINDLWSKYRE